MRARAAGQMVLVRSHAERIVVLLGDEVVADHPRFCAMTRALSSESDAGSREDDATHAAISVEAPGSRSTKG